MIIQIEIDCNTIQEFFKHLSVIRVEARRIMRKEKLNSDDDFAPTEWKDDNCYGNHTVSIIEDEMLVDRLPGTAMFSPSK